MLRDSHMLDVLRLKAYSPTGQVMCVDGDSAYPLKAHLQVPFRAGARGSTPAMELCNKKWVNDDDNTGIFYVCEIWIGMSEFDNRILALLKPFSLLLKQL